MDVDFGYVAFLAMGTYGVGVVLTHLPRLGLAALPVGIALRWPWLPPWPPSWEP